MTDIEDFLPLPYLPYHVLLALSEEETMHGWAIISRIEEITGDVGAPSSGSLYLAMGRLKERGLLAEVAAPTEETDSRRRYYRISGLGRRVLAAESGRMEELVRLARTAGVMNEES